eukprot:4810837-Amphidinium_carterae.1
MVSQIIHTNVHLTYKHVTTARTNQNQDIKTFQCKIAKFGGTNLKCKSNRVSSTSYPIPTVLLKSHCSYTCAERLARVPRGVTTGVASGALSLQLSRDQPPPAAYIFNILVKIKFIINLWTLVTCQSKLPLTMTTICLPCLHKIQRSIEQHVQAHH